MQIVQPDLTGQLINLVKRNTRENSSPVVGICPIIERYGLRQGSLTQSCFPGAYWETSNYIRSSRLDLSSSWTFQETPGNCFQYYWLEVKDLFSFSNIYNAIWINSVSHTNTNKQKNITLNFCNNSFSNRISYFWQNLPVHIVECTISLYTYYLSKLESIL
jgi:hypothetical protein